MSNILGGIVVGLVSGIIVGLLTIVPDAVFYSKNGKGLKSARQYSNPLIQLSVFLVISLFMVLYKELFYMGGSYLIY